LAQKPVQSQQQNPNNFEADGYISISRPVSRNAILFTDNVAKANTNTTNGGRVAGISTACGT
jgi:hypothetical protein